MKEKKGIRVWTAILGVMMSFSCLVAATYSEKVEAVESFHSTVKPKKKEYVISSDLTYAPFEYKNGKGEYVGIDVELMKRTAELSGFKVRMEFVGFQAAVDQLQAGQSDGLMGGMSITPMRKESFDFSTSYYDSHIRLTVKKGNPDKIEQFKDLNGKKIGVKIGTVAAEYLEKHRKEYGYVIKSFDAADGMYSSLSIGDVAAILDDEPVVAYAIKQGQDLEIVGKSVPTGKYGFAVKKGQNVELLQMFDNGLAYLKKTGEYKRIINKYTKANSDSEERSEKTFAGIIEVNWKLLLTGLKNTMILALVSFVLAMIVGIIIGLFSVAPVKALRAFATIYVDIIRGIPLMVVVIFIFYGLPSLFNCVLPRMLAGIIALTLNASAYIAEIVRGGVEAVPPGQMEASRSLGLGYVKTMRKIILPQAIRIMIPSFVNQFVISLKDTTIISAIGMAELVQTSKIIVARNLQSFRVYAIIGVLFLIVITSLTKLAKVLERKVKI